MLPIYRLATCATCGEENQGTRAKAGNSVRCVGCDTMRRVPMGRPEHGPDDPHAVLPTRGMPFAPGNPYRIQPPAAVPAGAWSTSVRPAPVRPVQPAPRRAAVAAPRRSATARPVRRSLTGPRIVEFGSHRPCEQCSNEGVRNSQGVWNGAVVKVEVKQNGQWKDNSDLCMFHLTRLTEVVKGRPEFSIRVRETGFIYDAHADCVHSGMDYDRDYGGYRCSTCGSVWRL